MIVSVWHKLNHYNSWNNEDTSNLNITYESLCFGIYRYLNKKLQNGCFLPLHMLLIAWVYQQWFWILCSSKLFCHIFCLFAKNTFLQIIKCYFWSFAKMHIYKVQSRLGEKIAKIISKSMVCKTITNIPKHHWGCVIAENIHFEAFFWKNL